MGKILPFRKELLLVGILSADDSPDDSADEEARDAAKSRLEQHYGPSSFAGPSIPFTYTDYYAEEMGDRLKKDFIAFDTLVDPSLLADIKLVSNRIEEELTRGGRRSVNLDPGLLSLGKLILASTKDHAHRIPLRDGIYAEVTLVYRDKSYRPLPWTYPDFRSPEYLEILHGLRGRFKERLRAGE